MYKFHVKASLGSRLETGNLMFVDDRGREVYISTNIEKRMESTTDFRLTDITISSPGKRGRRRFRIYRVEVDGKVGEDKFKGDKEAYRELMKNIDLKSISDDYPRLCEELKKHNK